ncbi:hypothetical protein C2E21_9105 [Chlorella sorokiniana]|uniref:Uncharacterized protein n=1 Tax=Chlorella sorokiniana TaxID=3076 RepID=A0A2P6TCL2_CHLSO|nr:hypothetical protein C2E21_9105 [Chlorella sorokiniana]|eukprot:PRW20380.1 hypothetical protein C2E21_9105 [Chlorella sorokiniana]
MAKLVDLEERTERHPQLAGRRFAAVAPEAVAQQLVGAHFLGAGSFCRVWRVDNWTASSRYRNQPVMVPPTKDDAVQEPRLLEVMGLVEELCSQASLHHFSWRVSQQPTLRALWPVHHIAAEFAALMEQLDNIMVHMPAGPAALPLLKLGDLNGAQWQELTREGASWLGTVGFMPRRVRRLYLGEQRTPAAGVGELNYDTYQMGKTLLRVLLEHAGTFVSYPKGTAEEMEQDETNVKGSAITLLTPTLPCGIDTELLTFGVLTALMMSWDGPYTSPADQLRLLPGQAAECLRQWAALCKQWAVTSGGAAFWGATASQRALAELYLRMAELARMPPLDEPLDPGVHVQECGFIAEVVDNFFHYGLHAEERLGPVQGQAAAILQERRELAAGWAAAQAAAAQMAVAEAERRKRFERPSHRSTAWESKVAVRAEQEAAFLEGSSTGRDENAQANNRRKRKAAAVAPAAKKAKPAAAVKPAVAAKPAKAGAAAAAAAAGAPNAAEAENEPPGGDALVLSNKLRLKDVWGEGAREKEKLPQLVGKEHCIAVMLGETVRAALAARTGADALTLQLSKGCRVTFSVARRSVQFSRRELQALAKDVAACKKWNTFVAAALAAWQQEGKEGSQAARLGLLAPLQAAG